MSLPRRLLPAVIILMAVGAVFGLSKMKGRQTPSEPPVVPPVNVEVMAIEPIAEMPDIVELPGVVEVNKTVSVAAEVDGRVEKKLVSEGQSVQKGQELIRLNTEMLQADYDRAAADEKYTKNDLEHVKALYDKQVATTQEVDQAKMRAAMSDAVLRQAKARLDRAVVHSPLAGIVDRVPVEEGEYVMPGKCVAKVVDIETVKVVVEAPERDVVKIRLQDGAEVISGGRNCAGKITYISQLADDSTRTCRVEISVDNRPGADGRRPLRSGQIVRVMLSRGAMKDVVMIPLLAVIPLEGGKEVFCVKDGKAWSKRIALGAIKGDKVQVLPDKDMLEKGDLLIISGHRFVSDGQAVALPGAK